MEICIAPTLRFKALNKQSITHIMYIEMEMLSTIKMYIIRKEKKKLTHNVDKGSSVTMQKTHTHTHTGTHTQAHTHRHTHTGAHTQAHTHTDTHTQAHTHTHTHTCLLYTSPSPRDQLSSRMPSSA